MLTTAMEYKVWADLRSLKAISLIDRFHFAQEYEFSLQQINHMLIVEELFYARLTASPPPHPATNSEIVPDYPTLKDRLIRSGYKYQSYLSGLTQTQSDTQLNFTFADGKKGCMSIEEILFHIINHGSYHRGSIARALDQAGVPHPADGYGIFIHERQPHRRESS